MKTICAVAVAAIFSAGTASAVTLDFLAEANGNERGVADNFVLNNANTGNINVTLSAGQFGGGDAFAYLDSGNAGLGACKVLTSYHQCNPSSDDNVTAGEFVTIAFDVAMDLTNFVFRQANHDRISATSTQTLQVNVNGGGFSDTTFGDLSTLGLLGVNSLSLGYGGATPNQFYLSSVVAEPSPDAPPIPLPAAAWLMLAGLGGLGIAGRRKG